MHEGNSNFEALPDFKAKLESVIDRPLTVEDIEGYAETALTDIIYLVQSAVEHYKHYPTHSFESETDCEDAAFKYFGLSNIEQILDHLALKASEISNLDHFISSATNVQKVIVPPSAAEIIVNQGKEQFVPKRLIPRLKTLLFVLANDFQIELENPNQLSLMRGEVHPDMVRRSSYYLVEAHQLDRSVLVCDEEGNATYSERLLELTKPELDELLDTDPTLGQKIIYSKNFVLRAIAAISDPHQKNNQKTKGVNSERGKYLYPPAPEGVLSIFGIAREFGVNNHLIKQAITELGEELGEASNYRFTTRSTSGYTLEQQWKIRQLLETRGSLAPKAPEGILALHGVAQALGIPTKTIVRRAIENLGETLGETSLYKFGGRVAIGYNPDQQKLIREYLEKTGYFNRPPEGFLTMGAISKEFDLVFTVIDRIVKELGDELGETEVYMAQPGMTTHYSPAQIDMIRQRLEAEGSFAPPAPDDYLSIAGIARKAGVDHITAAKAIEEIVDSLGDVGTYKFQTQVTSGYSPNQQRIIYEYFDKKGFMVDKAPNDVLSLPGLLDLPELLGSGDKPIRAAINALGESLGEIKNYRFGSRKTIAKGFDREQQQKIIEHLRSRGVLDEAPNDYVNAFDLSKQLGVKYNQIRIVIKELGQELGKTNIFKSKTQVVEHYDPSQQELIRTRLEQRGFINSDPPEGYMPISAIAKKVDVSYATAVRAVEELEDIGLLGETKQYRFKTLFTKGYSPEQQEIITEHLKQKLSRRKKK
jgi:DNA-binding MarR family transcriptional regulator